MRIEAEHIPVLAAFFVRKYSQELACPDKEITPPVLKKIREHPWRDIRELESAMKRSVTLAPRAEVIAEVELPTPEPVPAGAIQDLALEEIVRQRLVAFLSKWGGHDMTDLYDEVIQQVERPLIELILERTRGNQVKAAKILGINRNTLFKKMKLLGHPVRS